LTDDEIMEEIIDPLMVCQDCRSISVALVSRKKMIDGELRTILILKCEGCGRWRYTIDEKLIVSPVKNWKKPKTTTVVEEKPICEECGILPVKEN
jgi:hypothetical protein